MNGKVPKTDARNRRLAQTILDPEMVRKLDVLAEATGHTRSSYLRHVIEMHVRALWPKGSTTSEVVELIRSLSVEPKHLMPKRPR